MNLLELLREQRLAVQDRPSATNPRALTLAKRHAYAHDDQVDEKLTYYRGLKPDDDDKLSFLKIMRTADKIGPSLKRFVSGKLSRDPEWTIKRKDSDVTSDILAAYEAQEANGSEKKITAEQAKIAKELNDLEDSVTTWHKSSKLHKWLRRADYDALWAGSAELRPYVPNIYADDDRVQNRTFDTVEEALSVIYLNAYDPRQGGALYDEHGNTVAHYYEYVQIEEANGTKKEVTYVELYEKDQISVYREGIHNLELYGEPKPNPLPPGEYLPVTLEREDGSILTVSIIDAQDTLNELAVEKRRNGHMGGYRQYITINAENPTDETGEPTNYKFGPSVVNNIVGFPYRDDNNKIIGITTPQIHVFDPVPQAVFHEDMRFETFEILKRFDQAHFEADFLAISGDSKKESREAWEERLELESVPTSETLGTLLSNVLRFAYWLTGKDDRAFDIYEFIPTLHLNVSASDLDSVISSASLVGDGLMTMETHVMTNPLVTNKEAEIASLKAGREKTEALKPPEPIEPQGEEVETP